ncbi:MAG: hypothetical protein U1F65_03150 [Verrucomicrobiota bacterium]
MKPEPFENQLQQQPLRPVPAEWRADILAAARKAERADGHSPAEDRQTFLQMLWRELFWTRRRLWAGLAAVWVVILLLNLDGARVAELADSHPAPANDVIMVLREPDRWLAQLNVAGETLEADRPKRAPQPHSRRRENFVQV